MQETSTKQRELKNVSYNYLVESCVDPIKSKTVLAMMNETLQEDFDTLDDVYKNSEYEDKIIEGILLNTTATFATRFMEAHQRNSELTKKTVIENYSKIVKDNSMRREVLSC